MQIRKGKDVGGTKDGALFVEAAAKKLRVADESFLGYVVKYYKQNSFWKYKKYRSSVITGYSVFTEPLCSLSILLSKCIKGTAWEEKGYGIT